MEGVNIREIQIKALELLSHMINIDQSDINVGAIQQLFGRNLSSCDVELRLHRFYQLAGKAFVI